MSAPLPGSDLLIVGGGPAGLATAIAARLAGLEVTLLEARHPPIDKACGEGIMPDGVELLRGWGVELSPAESHRFSGIRFLDEQAVAQGDFPHGAGLAVRRTDLHAALAARAADLGARLLWGVRAERLLSGGAETPAGFIATTWIAAADGLHSRIRRACGLAAPAPRSERFGVRRHFERAPWSDHVEVYWADRCEAYVTPVGPREVGVALLWSGKRRSFGDLLSRFPLLEERLGSAAAVSGELGAGPLRQRARRVVRGNVALIGDAAGYLDAISGEGLALSFQQAAALAESLHGGSLRHYAREHRRLTRRANFLTHLLLVAEGRMRVRRRMIQTLAADPALFSRLLGVHSRALPVRSVRPAGALRLLRCLF